MKAYSLKVTRLITQHEITRTFDTIDSLIKFRNDVINKIKTDPRSKNESFQLISKQHKDTAFDYVILESQIVNN